ncbi:dtdp-glucose pyrophosphorylase [Halogeometricum borinquense DSM 11551]|nr:dtdp-glucose pyrophosphorylase [Halogeometricum borinquense DSM 11551]
MVRLAGRPILGHILVSLSNTRIEEVVIVVGGQMKAQIIDYSTAMFGDRFDITFVEQEQAEGLGHSIYQAEEVCRGDSLLIALGDMLFEKGYEKFLQAHNQLDDVDGSIGVKQVEEPQHYGVVEVNGEERIEQLVEKPDNPPSDLAISGIYLIEDSDLLFDSLAELVENDERGAGGEYQLTDALQRMIDFEADLGTFEVYNWYDCGRPGTLLEANRVLLSKQESLGTVHTDSAVIVPPVDIGDDVTLESSVIGPNVSIDSGTSIRNSIIKDSIIGGEATLESANLEHSIVGSSARVHGEANHLNVGDSSTVNL